MTSEKLILSLVPADTDPPLRSPEYQQGLSEVGTALSAQGIKVSNLVDLEEAEGSETTILLGFTIELAKIVGPVFAGVVGAWLHARYGRKARLKIGDIEAEARTVEEVERLIASVKKLKHRC